MIGRFANSSTIQKEWNEFFKKEGRDAYFDKYPTTISTIPERLSEMFHFDRRLYVVGDSLQAEICFSLDALDSSAQKSGKVNVILNEDGVLKGFFLKSISPALLKKFDL